MAIEAVKPSAPGYANFGNNQPPPYLPMPVNCHQPIANPSHTVINVSSTTPASVVYVGGCPSCRIGVLRKSHCTFCGILWSILLFPIGLLCLCCCTKDRCSNCSYTQ